MRLRGDPMTAVLVVAVWVSCAATISCAVQLIAMARRYRTLATELTELQAIVDAMLMDHGRPPVFALRYGMTLATDPTKIPPPSDV